MILSDNSSCVWVTENGCVCFLLFVSVINKFNLISLFLFSFLPYFLHPLFYLRFYIKFKCVLNYLALNKFKIIRTTFLFLFLSLSIFIFISTFLPSFSCSFQKKKKKTKNVRPFGLFIFSVYELSQKKKNFKWLSNLK